MTATNMCSNFVGFRSSPPLNSLNYEMTSTALVLYIQPVAADSASILTALPITDRNSKLWTFSEYGSMLTLSDFLEMAMNHCIPHCYFNIVLLSSFTHTHNSCTLHTQLLCTQLLHTQLLHTQLLCTQLLHTQLLHTQLLHTQQS